MGEESKKPEEKKAEEKKVEEEEKKPAAPEEKKPEGAKNEEKKDEKKEEKKEEKAEESKESPPPPPPEEFVYKVFMHCEGCARKVKRSLKGFEGVEDVQTDCKVHKVIVKGKKADPLKVLDRIQRKSHRKVELLTPLPKPPAEEPKKAEDEKPKPEEKKEEPQVIVVVLKVHMHCEACSEEIKKRILKMKGVQSADPDLKSSQVTVKGVFDPPKLVEYVYKRAGKHAVIVKQELEKKKEEEKGGEKDGKEGEKKEESGEKAKGEEGEKEKKEGEEGKDGGGEGEGEETKVFDMKKMEYVYPPHLKYNMEYVYAPQIFSDENPNACSVM